MKKGIDVSHLQGVVDWSKAKEGLTFAFVKATQGTTFVDPQFAHNWKTISEEGLIRGAYSFCDPSQDMGLAGTFFAQTVGALKKGEFVWADVEAVIYKENGAEKDKWMDFTQAERELKLNHFLVAADAEFTKLSGFPVLTGIYTDEGNWNDYFSASYDHSGRQLWLARISSTEPKPIGMWKKLSFWQYSWTGTVSGIEGNVVDLDYMLE